MFASIVEHGKFERALDLVHRLHLEKSFDLAMALADNHRKLVDLIEEAKDCRFGQHEDVDYSETPEEFHGDEPMRRISPDSNFRPKRAFDNLKEPSKLQETNQVKRRRPFA